MTEINDWNGAFLPDGETDCCQACSGRGGNTTTQDPVGDGGGTETLFDACPECIGQGLCPGCMGALGTPEPNNPYVCASGCGWDASEIDNEDYEPSWGDYGDDGF